MSEKLNANFTHPMPVDDLVRSFLQRMLDHLPVALFCKDARNDFQNVFWNSTCERMFGHSALAVVGKSDFDIYKHDEAEFFRKIDIETMRSGKTYYVPEEPITIGGEQLYLRTWKIPMYSDDGAPQWLLGITQDITEMKRMEKAAKRSTSAQIALLANAALEKLKAGDTNATKNLLEQIAQATTQQK